LLRWDAGLKYSYEDFPEAKETLRAIKKAGASAGLSRELVWLEVEFQSELNLPVGSESHTSLDRRGHSAKRGAACEVQRLAGLELSRSGS
jgi:hypothetical protein